MAEMSCAVEAMETGAAAKVDTVDALDDELLDLVLSHCDGLTLPVVFLVNRKWHRVADGQKRARDAVRPCTYIWTHGPYPNGQRLHLSDPDELRAGWCPRHRCKTEQCHTKRYMRGLLDVNHASLAKWAHDTLGMALPLYDACVGAARHGDPEAIEWLRQHGCEPSPKALEEALRCGHHEVFQTLVDIVDTWERSGRVATQGKRLVGVASAAAGHGTRDTLEWVARRGATFDASHMADAARTNNRVALEWLYARLASSDRTVDFSEAYCKAAFNGDTSTIEWIHARRQEYEHDREQRCTMQTYRRTVHSDWDKEVTRAAASSGHLPVLQWMHARRFRIDGYAQRLASTSGHLHVLQWLHDHVQACRPRICEDAVMRGHLHVLEWTRKVGITWSVDLCARAVGCGDLDTLQWLRARDCPWDENTLIDAIRRCSLEAFDWAWDNGCPRPRDVVLYEWAVEGGHLRAVRHLRCAKRLPWDSTVCAVAARYGKLQILKWAHRQGCPWDASVCESLVTRRDLHGLVWARKHGCPWDRAASLHQAQASLAEYETQVYNPDGVETASLERIVAWIDAQTPNDPMDNGCKVCDVADRTIDAPKEDTTAQETSTPRW